MSSAKTQTQLQPFFFYHIQNPQVRTQTFVSIAATVSSATHWVHSPLLSLYLLPAIQDTQV